MNKEAKVVFGIYKSQADAENAVEKLRVGGFRLTDVSVLLPRKEGSQELRHVKETKAPEAAVTGAGTGAVIGGTLGLLAGIGALAIPGVGPLIAAGPIMAAFAGMGIGGTVGGLSGAHIGWGLPEYEAKRYEGRLQEGGILLSVHADDAEWADRARAVLEATGADDISVTVEKKVKDSATGAGTSYNKKEMDQNQPPFRPV
jgi:hypothetical protein